MREADRKFSYFWILGLLSFAVILYCLIVFYIAFETIIEVHTENSAIELTLIEIFLIHHGMYEFRFLVFVFNSYMVIITLIAEGVLAVQIKRNAPYRQLVWPLIAQLNVAGFLLLLILLSPFESGMVPYRYVKSLVGPDANIFPGLRSSRTPQQVLLPLVIGQIQLALAALAKKVKDDPKTEKTVLGDIEKEGDYSAKLMYPDRDTRTRRRFKRRNRKEAEDQSMTEKENL